MEQLPLDLSPEAEPALELLTRSELLLLYSQKIGVPARTQDKNELITGISNPDNERNRLREIDNEEDKRELAAPYKR